MTEETMSERERVAALKRKFETELERLGHPIFINGARAKRHPGSSNVGFASGIPGPSHVLRAMGLSADDGEASIRFSLGRFTTEADVARALGQISEALV
jgi:cysteine desulfurase